MTGRPGYRTMEMIGGSSAPYLARTPCVPLFCSSFNRVGNKERFRLPGAGGGSFPLYGGTFARSYSVSKWDVLFEMVKTALRSAEKFSELSSQNCSLSPRYPSTPLQEWERKTRQDGKKWPDSTSAAILRAVGHIIVLFFPLQSSWFSWDCETPGLETPKNLFEAIFCLKKYFYFLRLCLKTLQEYPFKQA